jgi:ubiquinone/menaquinone biosynthesis C-methylase UbiE
MSINNKKENWNEIFENLQKKFDEQNNSLGGKKTKNKKTKNKKTKNKKTKNKKTKKITN